MKSIFTILIILITLTSGFCFADCDSRIITRVAPQWVNHSAQVLNRHEICVVQVEYELDSKGVALIKGSTTEIEDCNRFKNSAETSVEKYTFSEGNKETCLVTVGFKLDE